MATITYIDAQGNRKTGYTKDGKAYSDEGGMNPLGAGSVYSAADGQQHVSGVGDDGASMPYTDYLAKQGMSSIDYTDPQGQQKSGYLKNGSVYADILGSTPVGAGSIYSTEGQRYVAGVGENGGDMLYSDFISRKGETSEADTPKAENTPYIDYMNLIKENGVDESGSYAMQLKQNADNAEKLITDLNESYEGVNTQLYRDYMQRKKNMPQQLAAQGISGGLSETSLLGLETVYQDALKQNERDRLAGIRDIQSAGNGEQLTIMQNYHKEEQARAAEVAAALASLGDFSGYKALGYTDEQIAALKAVWDAQHAPKAVYYGGPYADPEDPDDLEEYSIITSDDQLGAVASAANRSLANAVAGGTVRKSAVLDVIIKRENEGKISPEEADYLLRKYNLNP